MGRVVQRDELPEVSEHVSTSVKYKLDLLQITQ